MNAPVVVSLYDKTGHMVRPWANAGAACYCYDLEQANPRVERVGRGTITYIRADLRDPGVQRSIVALRPRIMFGFPPCDDLAVSGSKHFAGKLAKNPNVFNEAIALVRVTPDLANEVGCPYMFENPVSLVASMYGPSDYRFNPCDYGGYLPDDDVHPEWPSYILPRDAYEKKTCLWVGNGFVMPTKRPVQPITIEYANGVRGSTQFAKLGGKSQKTKDIRSATPRGFALAAFEANAWGVFSV